MSLEQRRVLLFLLVVVIVCASLLLYLNSIPPTKSSPPSRTERIGPARLYPDPQRTPGVTDPSITQANIHDTICNLDWSTKLVRPSSSYTSRLKREQIRELGLPGTPSDYEEDHFIPLELAGDPKDPRNLWPEPYEEPGAKQKDVVENYLHREVCSGGMSLSDAQRLIATDWYRLYIETHQRTEP